MTTFGDQVFEFGGAPVGGAGRFTSPWATHYFVDSDNGSASNGGKRPDDAMKTIQQAVNLATGGDVIYIRPRLYQWGQGFRRYEEDVSITAGSTTGSGNVAVQANKSLIGVTQRGIPNDLQGVRLKYGSSKLALTISAPATHIENISIFAEAATTYAVLIDHDGATRSKGGDGVSLYNVGVKSDKPLYANGGDGLQIVNCEIKAKYDGTMGGIQLVGSANVNSHTQIIGCSFKGGSTAAMSTAAIAITAPAYDIQIRDCYFSRDPVSGGYITISASTNMSGIVANNYFASTDATAKLTDLDTHAKNVWGAGNYDENGVIDSS
jgi:hypothetical protein